MGVQPIYSNNGLLGNRIVTYCPKPADFSFTSLTFGVPVVVDISKQSCTPDLYTKDSGAINTNGCCVLDFSYQNCHEIINVKDEEEEFYDMNIRYLDTSTQVERNKGERKICYTAPLKKKPLYVMELLREIAVDITALIAIVLVGACYEYWIIYGNCSTNGIETLLSDAPYSVNEYITKRVDNYTIKMSKECESSDIKTDTIQVEWYDTFPYNIITFFNKPIIKTKATESIRDNDAENSTSSNSSLNPAELFKIPIRGFLLGLIIVIATWVGGIIAVFYSLVTFVGYRKGSYERYVINPQPLPTAAEKKSQNPFKNFTVEKFEHLFDFYGLIEQLFRFKKTLLSDEETDLLSNIDDSQIRNEEILNWFFPIRRSELILSWGFSYFGATLMKFCDFAMFTTCLKDDVEIPCDKWKKWYWYLITMYNNKINLFNPLFTLNVDCAEIEEATHERNRSNTWFGTLAIFTIWVLIVFYIRFHMFFLSLGLLFAAALVLPFLNVLWMTLIFMIVIYSMIFSVFGNMLAFFFMNFYIILGFFYIPFKNYTKLFQIIKSHGNMLTLLFCIVVVVHAVKVLHPTSAGVVGGLLALLILYKLIVTFSV